MSVAFFARLTKEEIGKIQSPSSRNIGRLKEYLDKSYAEIDQLQAEKVIPPTSLIYLNFCLSI